jgi:integrase
MKDVGIQPYLIRRGGIWHFRRQVPKELRAIIGKSAIKQSLDTGTHKVAAEKARAIAARVDAQFAEARRKLKKVPGKRAAVSQHELQQIVILHLHRLETKQVQDDLASEHMDEETRQAELSDLGHVIASLKALETSDHPDGLMIMKQVIDPLMAKHDLNLDPSGQSYRFLFDVTRRAMIEHARRRFQWMDEGTNGSTFDPMFKDVTAHRRPAAASPNPSVTVAELITRYTSEPDHQRLAKGTRDKYATIIRLMKETFGATAYIRELTVADFKKVRALLMIVPANATKLYKGKTFAEAAELAQKGGRPPMNPSTANNHLQFMSAIFAYAVKEELLDKNRAAGLTVPRDEELPDEEKRNPFTTPELRAIFAAPLYTGCKNDGPGYKVPGPNVVRRGRFWVPLISLFTGMRLDECCQLLTDDVAEREGTTVFINRLSKDGEKKLKTKSSRRIIPVHSALVRLGFLAFVEEKRKAGAKHLFPELRTSEAGKHSSAVSKWWRRFMEDLGIKRPDITFHSFRHTFRDAMRRGHVHPLIEDALGGWANGEKGTKEIYGAGYPPEMLAGELEKVSYPGLDLSHLHR